MDAQTVLIIWAVGAYLGMTAVYILEGGGLDCIGAAIWPVTLAVMVAILVFILPAEGLKWILRRCKGGR